MKKQYIVTTLNRIKEYIDKNNRLVKLGIDVSEYYEGLVNLLEESICHLTSSTDKQFEENLELVHWWLYDQPNKIFYYQDKPNLDVNKPEDFADFLLKQPNNK